MTDDPQHATKDGVAPLTLVLLGLAGVVAVVGAVLRWREGDRWLAVLMAVVAAAMLVGLYFVRTRRERLYRANLARGTATVLLWVFGVGIAIQLVAVVGNLVAGDVTQATTPGALVFLFGAQAVELVRARRAAPTTDR